MAKPAVDIYIVWSPTVGPIRAYVGDRAEINAAKHRRAMLGVEVGHCELAEELPENVLLDLENEYEGDEITPIEIVDIDDPT